MGLDDEWDDDDWAEEKDALIVDNGSAYIKAGLACFEEPATVASCVAVPSFPANIHTRASGVKSPDVYIGEEAQRKRGLCSVRWPIEDGIVNDWDAMEKIWDHLMDRELAITADDISGVLIAEPPLNPLKTRARIMQIWMEKYDAPNYFVALSGQLALMGSDKQTGLCIDSGDGVTTIMAMVESTILSHAMFRIPLGGRQCTRLMERLLMDAGHYLSTTASRISVMEIKKECYVSLSFDDELEALRDGSKASKSFRLPDNSQVELTKQLIQVPELMFQPSLYGHETMGLHQLVRHCVEACSLDVRAELLQNVLLCGGNSMFPNMAERLQAEIRGFIDPDWEKTLPMFKKAQCDIIRKSSQKDDPC